jgi:hypothetical protein
MIPPVVHGLVEFSRHVAVQTTHALMMAVIRGLIFRGLVAREAKGVSFCSKTGRVRVVTVGANHSRLVHLALQK